MASDITQSPFVEARSFTVQETKTDEAPPRIEPAGYPFLSEYELEGIPETTDPKAEAYMSFLNELYSEEFDETLFELFTEASSMSQDRVSGEQYRQDGVEMLLEQHFAPLLRESETMLDTLASSLDQHDPGSLSEGEIESQIDQYHPVGALSPSFENFFGAIKKLAKKAIGGAISLAKKGIQTVSKLGLGFLLKKLRALLPYLVEKVFRLAINKLPSGLQPYARKLAERLPFLKEAQDMGEQQVNDASIDITELQQDFNRQIADLLFASSEVEQELEVARVTKEARVPTNVSLTDLDHARERFVNEISQLKEGEDPTPYLENFIPAILPVLKVGFRLIGRHRVISFLAGLLAKLIQKFIGPQYAPALSRAIVDAGLRLIHLEVTPQDEVRAAPVAVAATVEDTVRQVAALPEYLLDKPELLEGFALEAFEQAAAANLPPILPESVYQRRPDLLESEGIKGCWLPMPLRGPKRYKKFSRVFQVAVTPHKAMVVQTFGETRLADFLQDQLGLTPGATVEAEAHLYESLPGTTLPELARLETATPGLGSNAEQVIAQLHPLTLESAGLLLGEPSLGRSVSPRYLSDRRTIGVGQRFYHLAIPGHRPLMVPEPGGRASIRRLPTLRITLNFPADQIVVKLFLSEVKAQELAVKLRKQTHLGTVITPLGRMLDRHLPAVLSGLLRGRVKIIHEALMPELALGGALQRLPNVALGMLSKQLREWLIGSLANFLKEQAQHLIAASEDPKDGITLIFTVFNPPGFSLLRQALRGKIAPLSGLSLQGSAPRVRIDVVSGYSYD